MNNFSLNLQPSDTLWYTPMEHQQQKSYPFFYQTHQTYKYEDVDSDNSSSNANADRSETASSLSQHPPSSSTTTSTPVVQEKEHMFEKPLTPSDVGKLNRLVIPKQHAEKYFPMAGVSTAAAAAAAAGDVSGGSTTGGGGVLLGFEDEAGKCWRFRYSYWNSSQSYVLTKGWSRYVKEKKLDAGDVVLFERHRFDPDRFFIGWRRRGASQGQVHPSQGTWTAAARSSYNNNGSHHNHQGYNNNSNNNYINHHQQNVVQAQGYTASHQIAAFPYPPETFHAGTEVRQKAKRSGGGNSKRVRLFGVNLECQLHEDEPQDNDDEPQTSDGSSLSSQGQCGLPPGSALGPTAYNYFDYMGYPPNHHHMEMNFPHDVNQMRNRLG